MDIEKKLSQLKDIKKILILIDELHKTFISYLGEVEGEAIEERKEKFDSKDQSDDSKDQIEKDIKMMKVSGGKDEIEIKSNFNPHKLSEEHKRILLSAFEKMLKE